MFSRGLLHHRGSNDDDDDGHDHNNDHENDYVSWKRFDNLALMLSSPLVFYYTVR